MPQSALKFDLEVMPEGLIEFRVPFPTGARVIVFVVEEPADSCEDLVAASHSSLDFWNNPLDDQDWNDA